MFRRLEQRTALTPGEGRLLGLAFLLAGGGLLVRVDDPVAYLAWAALSAPAVGVFVGASGLGAFYGATVADDRSVNFSVWRQQQTLDDMLAAIG